MQTVTTIGLDIAKSVFQVHGVDVPGQAWRSLKGHCEQFQKCPIKPNKSHHLPQRLCRASGLIFTANFEQFRDASLSAGQV